MSERETEIDSGGACHLGSCEGLKGVDDGLGVGLLLGYCEEGTKC